MSYRFEEINITADAPFANCKLGRQRYAEILGQILSNGSDGYVMSLNGSWGTGKSTFVKMWQQMLKNEGYTTLYFNAWEHDYISDPLVGLIGELSKVCSKENAKRHFDTIKTIAGKLFLRIVPTLGKHIAEHYFGEGVADTISEALSEGADIFKSEIDKYQEESESLQAFRKSLKEFAESCDEEHPLVFFVDELDRCNPTFAVKVLERIKHLFAVPHVVFVLSIDKEQLANSVRGFYGSDRIDADEYLRRFIDVEYFLPKPDYNSFINYVCDTLELDALISKNCDKDRSHQECVKSLIVRLLSEKNLTLRQIEKILIHTKLVLQSQQNNNNHCPEVLIMLLYFRFFEHDLYLKIKKRDLDIQQLADAVEKALGQNVFGKKGKYDSAIPTFITFALAELYKFYSIDNNGYQVHELTHKDNDNNDKLAFCTKLPQELLLKDFDDIYPAITILQDMFERIDLLHELSYGQQ